MAVVFTEGRNREAKVNNKNGERSGCQKEEEEKMISFEFILFFILSFYIHIL